MAAEPEGRLQVPLNSGACRQQTLCWCQQIQRGVVTIFFWPSTRGVPVSHHSTVMEGVWTESIVCHM